MTIEDSITEEIKSKIEHAIKLAELGTSCELRVHLENKCPEDILDRASFIFSELDMHRTKFRNGILIYLALEDRKVAILGDAGINECIEPDTWNSIKESMIDYFKRELIEEGIVHAVIMAGEKMKKFFPIHADDSNELSNKVTTGEIGRRNE